MNNFMRILVFVAFLSKAKGGAPHSGYCIEDYCFTVFRITTDFSTAESRCKNSHGQLMTLRSAESDHVISSLLANLTGDFWIGLQLPDGKCSNTSTSLRGYKWLTGDTTVFNNWKSHEEVCSPRCVSVSKEDHKWKENPCNDQVDGFLCENKVNSTCLPIPTANHEYVRYKTLFGFEKETLVTIPGGSIATRYPFGNRFLCFSAIWMQAPWSCEFQKGGCEHECILLSHVPRCTCPRGKTISDNNISCTDASHDPCLKSGCKHECLRSGDTFVCVCNEGFELAKDGKTCDDIDECVDKRQCAGENLRCVNTVGGFKCECDIGFELNSGTCIDVDECLSYPCEHNCENTLGSYNCSCDPGYIPSLKDPTTCELYCSFEECPAIDCDPHNPSQCNCPTGFVLEEKGDQMVCYDIDECNHECDQNCANTYGSYVCSCIEGYELIKGYKCIRKGQPEGAGFTTPYELITPTIVDVTENQSVLTVGGLVGVTVCIVFLILLVVLLAHLIFKRRGKWKAATALKRHEEDSHDLEQVTAETSPKS